MPGRKEGRKGKIKSHFPSAKKERKKRKRKKITLPSAQAAAEPAECLYLRRPQSVVQAVILSAAPNRVLSLHTPFVNCGTKGQIPRAGWFVFLLLLGCLLPVLVLRQGLLLSPTVSLSYTSWLG